MSKEPPKRKDEDLRAVREAIKAEDIKTVAEKLSVVNLSDLKGDIAAIDTGDGETVIEAELPTWIEWDDEKQELKCASPELARLVKLVTGGDYEKIKTLARNRAFRLRVLADEGGWVRMALLGKLLDQVVENASKARDPYKQIMEIVESTQGRLDEAKKVKREQKLTENDGSRPGTASALRVLQRVDKKGR